MMVMMMMMIILRNNDDRFSVGGLPYTPLAIGKEPKTSNGTHGPKKKIVVKTIFKNTRSNHEYKVIVE